MSLIEIVVVIGIIAFLVALLLPAVNAIRKDYGGWADALPGTPPNEKDRVFSKHGFSLVIPPKWRLTDHPADDALAQIEATSGYRYASVLSAKLAHPRIKVDTFTETWRFGTEDVPSWQSEHEGRDFGYRLFIFEAAVRDGERLFLLTFKTHADVDGLPESAADYLRTFRLESKDATNQRVHPSAGGQASERGKATPAAH